MDGITARDEALRRTEIMPTGNLLRALRRAAALGMAAGLVLPACAPARAAQQAQHIDSFGPYKIGMTLAQARAAHKAAKPAACGAIAPERRCLSLDAAVFEEPARIFAVLDKAGARVDRIVAQLEPQLTRRRAYRCVRLSEKVFALLVVVYGSKYKQSYDENRQPVPAVAWDGALSGRLVFEAKCSGPDEGKPQISVIDYRPEGVAPPKVAQSPAAKPAPAPRQPAPAVAAAPPAREAPMPRAAPVGVVERIGPVAGDTASTKEAEAVAAVEHAKTRVEEEMAVAEGKMAPTRQASPPQGMPNAAARPPAAPATPPAGAPATPPEIPIRGAAAVPAPNPVPTPPATTSTPKLARAPAPATPANTAPTPAPTSPAATRPEQTASLPSIQPPRFDDPDALPEPTDLEAPEPFTVPEDEAYFRRLRAAPSSSGMPVPEHLIAASAAMPAPPAAEKPASAQPMPAAKAAPKPASLALAPSKPTVSSEAARDREVPTAAAEMPDRPSQEPPAPAPHANPRRFVPVLTGGWRHRAPVPPAKPWRVHGMSED